MEKRWEDKLRLTLYEHCKVRRNVKKDKTDTALNSHTEKRLQEKTSKL